MKLTLFEKIAATIVFFSIALFYVILAIVVIFWSAFIAHFCVNKLMIILQ